MLKFILSTIFFCATVVVAEQLKAIAYLQGKDSKVTGNVTFTQPDHGAPVTVEGRIIELQPNTEHGFHIHVRGDITGGCLSTKGHFNPTNKNHGAPNDTERHVGDLGNIKSDANGVAEFKIVDNVISLCGDNNILGRGVVVHSDPDDLGKGGHEDSLTTGHAGARLACGVIGILEPETPWKSGSSNYLASFMLTTISMLIVKFM